MLLKTSKGIEYVAEWIDKASTGDVYMTADRFTL